MTDTFELRMKVLIGTPIHESKDYCMQRWLENVANLQKESPANLLLVDNSPDTKYMKKMKGYCNKIGLTDYRIEHITLPPEQKNFERLARSREIIRQYVLKNEYDAWFSWESDQIIPTHALGTLVKIIQSGNFMIVSHNNWTRQNPDMPNFDFGVSLITRKALEKYRFVLKFGTDPDMPDTYEPSEAWFRKQVIRGGDSFLEIDGILKPIYHLDR